MVKTGTQKIIRGHPLVTFSDIREEALVLAQDRDEDNQPIRKKKEVPIYSETASNDLSKLVGEIRKEMAEMRIEMKEIRKERATPVHVHVCTKTRKDMLPMSVERAHKAELSFKRKEPVVGSRTIGSSEVQGSLVGDCPHVEINIGNVTIKCLLDTGSMVSTVTESFYNERLKTFQLSRSGT